MNIKSHALASSGAAAIVAAGAMLLLGVLGNMGLYTGAVEAMRQWHMFFDLSIGGILAGMVEAAVITFGIVYAFVWLYEKLLVKLSK
ncbi:MAG TPA: hypothetical protein VGA53_00895 [Candidatus Paceibacterota bacterium]